MYTKSAAAEIIGTIYYWGYGVSANPKKALSYLTYAAKGSYPYGKAAACMYLADMYYRGYGVQPNKALSLKYFKLAMYQNVNSVAKDWAYSEQDIYMANATR